MPRQNLAIALCRVSSLEQLESNSLSHQRDNVLKAADELGVIIPEDGIWSGHVSSKKGVNYDRKDLREMMEYCHRHPSVKYLIVQEVDRFMRSPDEQVYFQVKFMNEVGVKIWYADKPELNKDDIYAGLMRYMEGFRAAGSNDERQRKSINGQTKALEEGRFPFPPKPGYMKGCEKAIQTIDPIRGPILKNAMIRIVTRQVTPSQGLVELNKTVFVKGRTLYKMDKFRKILTDPFYAGIVECNKQVKVRNENGLHTPLITKDQHYELIKIMDGKKKNQAGPRKNGNPKYPLNNLVTHEPCQNLKYGRFVGVDINNGKNKDRVYEKYRCRECKRSIPREELHLKLVQLFRSYRVEGKAVDDLIEALNMVWRQKEGQAEQDSNRIKHDIAKLRESIANGIEAVMDPGNIGIKEDIMASIAKKKQEIIALEDELERTLAGAKNLKDDFLKFAFHFLNNMGDEVLSLSPEDRQKCKQVIFPSGFRIDENKNVYTPEISPLYRLVTTKKDSPETGKSSMVRVRRL